MCFFCCDVRHSHLNFEPLKSFEALVEYARVAEKELRTLIAALDLGTSKVTCFIAERNNQGDLCIIGIGQNTAEGLKAGAVIDMAKLGPVTWEPGEWTDVDTHTS